MSQSSGNVSSGSAWALTRLQGAICCVFTIHHLPCHHLPGAGQIQAGLLIPLQCCWGGVGAGVGALEPGWAPGWHGSSCLWICSPDLCCSPGWGWAPSGSPCHPSPWPGGSWVLLFHHMLVTVRQLACSLFSQKPIPAPHSRAEKAIKDSKTRHAKQNSLRGLIIAGLKTLSSLRVPGTSLVYVLGQKLCSACMCCSVLVPAGHGEGAEPNPAGQLPPGSILPLHQQEGDCTSNTFGPVLSSPLQPRWSQSCAVSMSKILAEAIDE